ncbi:hypothetical protein PGT21_002258 [Puccinia graminis f. sp. tritici]|nr:hypothetical protein PGT21_002258 [Puccinia graminis f. sp. tritici]
MFQQVPDASSKTGNTILLVFINVGQWVLDISAERRSSALVKQTAGLSPSPFRISYSIPVHHRFSESGPSGSKMNASLAIVFIVAAVLPSIVYSGVPNDLVFGRMYGALGIKPPSIVLQESRNPGLIIKNKHIAWITQSLDTPDGGRRLQKLIVECIIDLKRCGRIDLQNTWEAHMVTGSTKKKIAARPRSSSDNQIVDLRDKIYKLCLDWDTSELDRDRDSWVERKMMELEDVKPTLSTIELAFNFAAFSMLWRSYRISFSVAFQMAVFQHARVIPEEKLRVLMRFADNDPRKREVIGAFYGSMLSKKEASSYDAHSFQKAMRVILLKQFQFEMFDSPTITNFMKQTSGQEYFMLSEFVKLCQEVGPSMIKQPDLFWKQLEAASVQDDIQPLMKTYHKVCQYFRNGVPMDKAFEYYELVASIVLELKQLEQTETKKIRSENFNKLSKVTSNQKGTVDKEIKLESQDDEEKIIREKAERVIRDKFNLAMNYAEEFQMEPRSKSSRGVFRPTPRARRDQLQEIALLFRDLLTPRSVVDELDEVQHKISQEVSNARLPVVIRNKAMTFAVIVQHEITIPTAQRNLPEDASSQSAGRYGMFWSSKLSDAFGKAQEEGKLSTDDALLSSTPSLQNNQDIWDGIKSTIEREFGAISSANAENLIGCLKRVETYILRREISHRISHVMRKASDSEKIVALEWVQAKLDELQASPQQFIKPKEFEKLRQTLNLIKKHSKKGPSTVIWEQRISPKISELSIDLAMVLDEIFADLPYQFVADVIHK